MKIANIVMSFLMMWAGGAYASGGMHAADDVHEMLMFEEEQAPTLFEALLYEIDLGQKPVRPAVKVPQKNVVKAHDDEDEYEVRRTRRVLVRRPRYYRRYRTAPGYFGWGWGAPYSYGYYPYYGGYYSRPYFGWGFGFGRRHW